MVWGPFIWANSFHWTDNDVELVKGTWTQKFRCVWCFGRVGVRRWTSAWGSSRKMSSAMTLCCSARGRRSSDCMSRSWRPQRNFTRTSNPARTSWKAREMELQKWVWSGCDVRLLGSHDDSYRDSWLWKKKWQKTAIFFVFCFLFHGTYLKAREFECMVLVLLWKSNYRFTNTSVCVLFL